MESPSLLGFIAKNRFAWVSGIQETINLNLKALFSMCRQMAKFTL